MPQTRQFIRFALVGAGGFLVDAGISNLLVSGFHILPLVARIPAFLIASITTYAANRAFTFQATSTGVVQGWLKYVSSTSVGAVINYIVFSAAIAFVFRGPWAVFLAIAAGSAVGLVFNYYASTRFVFRPRP
jgi:putative flippase GtrA